MSLTAEFHTMWRLSLPFPGQCQPKDFSLKCYICNVPKHKWGEKTVLWHEVASIPWCKKSNSSIWKADEPKYPGPTLPSNYVLQIPQFWEFRLRIIKLEFLYLLDSHTRKQFCTSVFLLHPTKFVLIVNSQPCKVQEQIYSRERPKSKSA